MNVSGTRTEIITSPSGLAHAPRRNGITGAYIRVLDWRLTACGQVAEGGWSQGRRYGYVECRNCVKWLKGIGGDAEDNSP